MSDGKVTAGSRWLCMLPADRTSKELVVTRVTDTSVYWRWADDVDFGFNCEASHFPQWAKPIPSQEADPVPVGSRWKWTDHPTLEGEFTIICPTASGIGVRYVYDNGFQTWSDVDDVRMYATRLDTAPVEAAGSYLDKRLCPWGSRGCGPASLCGVCVEAHTKPVEAAGERTAVIGERFEWLLKTPGYFETGDVGAVTLIEEGGFYLRNERTGRTGVNPFPNPHASPACWRFVGPTRAEAAGEGVICVCGCTALDHHGCESACFACNHCDQFRAPPAPAQCAPGHDFSDPYCVVVDIVRGVTVEKTVTRLCVACGSSEAKGKCSPAPGWREGFRDGDERHNAALTATLDRQRTTPKPPRCGPPEALRNGWGSVVGGLWATRGRR